MTFVSVATMLARLVVAVRHKPVCLFLRTYANLGFRDFTVLEHCFILLEHLYFLACDCYPPCYYIVLCLLPPLFYYYLAVHYIVH